MSISSLPLRSTICNKNSKFVLGTAQFGGFYGTGDNRKIVNNVEFEKIINYSKYYSGILISNRFRNINKNLSRILLPHYSELMKSILNNYYLKDTYESQEAGMGKVDIFLVKE